MAAAQAQPPNLAASTEVVDTEVAEAASAASAASAPAMPDLDPAAIVNVFEQGCLLSAGQMAVAADWALAHGFEPLDGGVSGSAASMLGGQEGAVLVAPKTLGRVMLAVTQTQCTVWVDKTSGPPIRLAMDAWITRLVSQGDSAQLTMDRNGEYAGARRNRSEWRYRASGTVPTWSLGLATTVGTAQGTQVLRLVPLPAAASASSPAPAALPSSPQPAR